ncbi:hypothetical protein GI582_24125 [Sulfitobacter sp. BDSS02]|nr:hypothetical protein [Sulfitobacter sp. BDSS02]MBR9852508.1 hypothetical protein [Paracoccaceae bacterium]
MKHRFKECLAAAVFVAVLGGTAAVAAPLVPGDTIMMPGSTAASNPDLVGSVVQDSIPMTNTRQVPPGSNPLVNFADFEVQNRVLRSDADGNLIFAPRILFGRNVTPFPLLVNRVEMWGFSDFAIDASYRVDDVGDRGPTTGSRSADGQTLSFDFGFPLFVNNLFAGPQEESYFFSLKSETSSFANTGRLSIFAEAVGDPVQGRVYRFDVGGLAVPTTTVVPLPASMVMLIGAIAALFSQSLRRRGTT